MSSAHVGLYQVDSSVLPQRWNQERWYSLQFFYPLALLMMRMVFQNLKLLPNQFVRDLLPKLKELVYFHLDLFKKESFVILFHSTHA